MTSVNLLAYILLAQWRYDLPGGRGRDRNRVRADRGTDCGRDRRRSRHARHDAERALRFGGCRVVTIGEAAVDRDR